MHELGIAERILEVAVERARAAGSSRVTAVHLEVGRSSGVDPASLQLHWPIVSATSMARGATLDIRAVPRSSQLRMVAVDVDGADGGEATGAGPGGPGRAPFVTT